MTPMQLESIQANFDTCIFVNEELEVDCTTDDPNAVLELRSGDGMTVFPNASTSIVVTPSNIDSANMSFACIITNADGPCGQFEFRTSIAVYGKFCRGTYLYAFEHPSPRCLSGY